MRFLACAGWVKLWTLHEGHLLPVRAIIGLISRGSQQRRWVKPLLPVEFRLVATAPDKRRRWLRRFAMLGLASAGLLTSASYLSFYASPTCYGGGRMVFLADGCVCVQDHGQSQESGFFIGTMHGSTPGARWGAGLRGWFKLPRRFLNGWIAPVGPAVGLLAAVSLVIIWQTRQRIPEGHCRQCGYDLRGNDSGRCSECGAGVCAP
ncbi:MAG: hypothetical protein B6D36_13745 [Planctomycetes bacterium UTPLA1]|nr:MAG: hypothetical protein B6D36_13745 [Planctomycetes bacterium UTPLA1]